MSEIVPFPAVRRVGFIRNMAQVLATYSADGAERTLQARLDATRAAMLRKGIRPDVAGRGSSCTTVRPIRRKLETFSVSLTLKSRINLSGALELGADSAQRFLKLLVERSDLL
jgi:hypothetical protein